MKSRIIHRCTFKPLNTAKATDANNEKQIPQTLIKFRHAKLIEKQSHVIFIFQEKDTHQKLFNSYFFLVWLLLMFWKHYSEIYQKTNFCETHKQFSNMNKTEKKKSLFTSSKTIFITQKQNHTFQKLFSFFDLHNPKTLPNITLYFNHYSHNAISLKVRYHYKISTSVGDK